MPVIIKSINNRNKRLEKNEIIFFDNKEKKYITRSLITKLIFINPKNNILYLSNSYTEVELINNFSELNKNHIDIVEVNNLSLEEIENYIIDYKPDYIFIDYLKLTSIKDYLFVGDEKIKDSLNKLEECANKHGVKLLVAINKEY